MLLRTKTLPALVVMLVAWVVQSTHAKPITLYQHFTHSEETFLNERIPFTTGDTLYGPVRSNDFIFIRLAPQFGMVITAQDRFIEEEANPRFGREPIFNAPMLELPAAYPHLKRMARWMFDSGGGQIVHWLVLEDHSVEVYAYEAGEDPERNLVARLSLRSYIPNVVLVEGQVEVEGVLGRRERLTIYATGDIRLVDNVLYDFADERTGWYEEDGRQCMLGLVSEGSIIVKDTEANGRANGVEEDEDNFDRHSIAINGSLIALGGSFTFQHHNDDDDEYQGPEPDERGTIYHKGSIAQRQRGYIHRDNHDGTGYEKHYWYDFRLWNDAPPGFRANEYPLVEGTHRSLEISGKHTFRNVTVDELILYDGAEITLEGFNALTVNRRLIRYRTPWYPAGAIVNFHTAQSQGFSLVRMSGGGESILDLEQVKFERGVFCNLQADSLRILECDFTEDASFSGNIHLADSRFRGEVAAHAWSDLLFERCVFSGGLSLTGPEATGTVRNNTIVGSGTTGLALNRFGSLVIVNNILAFNRLGIVSDMDDPVLIYNDVFGNDDGDYVGCEAGVGSISADPRFVDWQDGSFELKKYSPCIDAGDPDAAADDDGTTADMGALAFDQRTSFKPFEVLSPADGDTAWDTEVTFRWSEAEPYAQYRVWLKARDEMFSAPTPYLIRAVDLDTLRRLLEAGSQLEWWVEAASGGEALGTTERSVLVLPFQDIEVSAERLEFEPLHVGFMDSLWFTVSNAGISPLTMRGMSIAPDNAAFLLRDDYEGVELGWDDSVTVWVVFRPEEELTGSAELTIRSDDAHESEITLHLEGEILGSFGYENVIPRELTLFGAYPNPFNSATRIVYGLPRDSEVRVTVLDLSGRVAARPVDAHQTAGVHEATWSAGETPAGVFIVRLSAGNETRSIKATLMR